MSGTTNIPDSSAMPGAYKPSATVIVSTYNSPSWLQKVLTGYFCQNRKDFEIVIADDGSKPATAELITALRQQSPVPLIHIWQKDDGFRKCRILNKAILNSRSDYLIFTDGDCIPRRDFVGTHLTRSRRGCYLSGASLLLSMPVSKLINTGDIEQQRCFDRHWLYQQGLRPGRKVLRICSGPRLAGFLNRYTPTSPNFKGSNASAWKADALRINGFDERMAYGGEDREFGVRLQNVGIKPLHVRYDAVLLHLDHAKAYRDPLLMKSNKLLRQQVEKKQIQRTEHGIQQLLDAGYQPQPAST